MQLRKIVFPLIALLSVGAEARVNPTESETRLDFRWSTFRELLTDCTERSKSLSCHRAGIYYIKKRHDYTNGVRFLKTACTLGRGYSCTLLGDFYKEGKIVKRDIYKAQEYYDKGCVRESGSGCRKYNALRVPPKPKKRDPWADFNKQFMNDDGY